VADDRLRLSLDVTAVPRDAVGAGQYTIELVRALAARSDLALFLPARKDDGPRWAGLAPGSQVVARAPSPRPWRLAWEQIRLPSLLGRLGVDVHHGPHDTMPERSRRPVVVTVHDLSFFVDPRWHERSKVLLFRRAIRVAARRAAVVVCPSRTTADELARWCRVEAEVAVAHHGVDGERFAPVEPAAGDDTRRLAAIDPRLVDARPWVAFVGTLEPRKDVPTLIRAFARVASRHPDALLVLAGGRGWGGDEVDVALAATGVGDRVVMTGYVADADVPAVLRSATAVAYPARYEGFGLPALEALSCGAALITTEGTAMAEVTGGAATLVPPGDERALADALDAELGGTVPTAERADRRRQGLQIAGAHTWAASADAHVVAYRRAVEIGGSPAPGS
jgi:glycosyltransferase involved in cell wall biosynthesis